jgi:acyl dehydratase
MGSIRFEGVRFAAYSNDHDPMHVHGFYAEVEVIVELRRDGTVLLADRREMR